MLLYVIGALGFLSIFAFFVRIIPSKFRENVTSTILLFWVGVKYGYLKEPFWKMPKINRNSVKNLQEKCDKVHPPVAVVTGGFGDIGWKIVQKLLSLNFKVIVLSLRDQDEEGHHANLHKIVCNLASKGDIFAAVEKILKLVPFVNLLINNAGVLAPEKCVGQEEENSSCPQFLTNCLSHCLLTNLLAEQLLNGWRNTGLARVVFVSSASLFAGGHLNLDPQIPYSKYASYARSKLALSLCAQEFSRRDPKGPIRYASLHPGVIPTGLYRNLNGIFRFLIRQFPGSAIFKSAEFAATEILQLCFTTEMVNGAYYENGHVVKLPNVSDTNLRRLNRTVDEFLVKGNF